MKDWIEWGGSDDAPHLSCKVNVKTRAGLIWDKPESVSDLKWSHRGVPGDIIAYRIADGWKKWHGGKCPIDQDKNVRVMFRHDKYEIVESAAKNFRWNHSARIEKRSQDVVAYCVVDGEQA